MDGAERGPQPLPAGGLPGRRLRAALRGRRVGRHRPPRTRAWLGNLATVVVGGVMQGGVYAMFAVGLTLIFGVMRIINAAHGEMVMMGAYLTWVAFFYLGVDPLLALVFTLPITFLFGDGGAEALAERRGRAARADRPPRSPSGSASP